MYEHFVVRNEIHSLNPDKHFYDNFIARVNSLTTIPLKTKLFVFKEQFVSNLNNKKEKNDGKKVRFPKSILITPLRNSKFKETHTDLRRLARS